MQTISFSEKISSAQPEVSVAYIHKNIAAKQFASPMVHGMHKSFIKLCMWMNVLLLNSFYYKNPVKAFKTLNNLRKIRSDYRGNLHKKPLMKQVKCITVAFKQPGALSNYSMALYKQAMNTDINTLVKK